MVDDSNAGGCPGDWPTRRRSPSERCLRFDGTCPDKEVAAVSNDLQQTVLRLLVEETEDGVYQAALAALVRRLDADRRAILRYNAGEFDTVASAGLSSMTDDMMRGNIRRLLEQSYLSGKPFVTDDVTDVRSATTASASTTESYRSLLCVPVDGFGVLGCMDRTAGAFADDDLEAVEPRGSYVAAALDRVQSDSEADGVSTNEGQPNPDIEAITAMLSHDVRNSLFIAGEYLELARTLDEDDLFEQVETAHDRLEELINGVVMLARTGNSVGTTEPVDLETVAERAWNVISANDAHLEVLDSAALEADEGQLCQVLENLFRNAVEHNDTGVTVRVGIADGDTLFVEDDGVGIDADRRDVVFNRSYSSKSDHSGLGLAIISRIVESHGWEIRAVEGTDGGARFEIAGVTLTSPEMSLD